MIRKMTLYRYTTFGDIMMVDEKRFHFRSIAQEKIVADDYAEQHGYFNGEGFIVVSNDAGVLYPIDLIEKQFAKIK